MRSFSFILFFWILSGGVLAQDSLLTVEKVVTLTVTHNYDVLQQKNVLKIAENNNVYGNAGFLPTVDVNGGVERQVQNTSQVFANGDQQSVDGATRDFVNAGIGLTWTIFEGTRRFATKRRLENSMLSASYALKLQTQDAVARSLRLFYTAFLERERLNLFQSNLDFSEERLRIIKQKYEVGKASKIELLQAQVDLNTDQSTFIDQNEVYINTKYNLNEAMGKSPDYDYSLKYAFEVDSLIILDEIISNAKLRNPAILNQLTNQEIQKNRIQELSRERSPQLDFNVGYNYSNLESEAGFLFQNRTNAWNYGVTASVNIFNGFNLNRQIQNAEIDAQNEKLIADALKLNIETNIKAVYMTYKNNLALLKLEEANLAVAKENSEIALDRFRLGVGDALEVREAQINAVNAQTRLLEAAFNAKTAELELKRLSGTLIQESE